MYFISRSSQKCISLGNTACKNSLYKGIRDTKNDWQKVSESWFEMGVKRYMIWSSQIRIHVKRIDPALLKTALKVLTMWRSRTRTSTMPSCQLCLQISTGGLGSWALGWLPVSKYVFRIRFQFSFSCNWSCSGLQVLGRFRLNSFFCQSSLLWIFTNIFTMTG